MFFESINAKAVKYATKKMDFEQRQERKFDREKSLLRDKKGERQNV